MRGGIEYIFNMKLKEEEEEEEEDIELLHEIGWFQLVHGSLFPTHDA